MTARHEIALRVAKREFAQANPRCANLHKHVEAQDIRDWLDAPERDLGAEWDEITGDDFLGNYGMDASELGRILYDRPAELLFTLINLRNLCVSYGIVRRAYIPLREMIDDASLTTGQDAKAREIESREQHQKDTML